MDASGRLIEDRNQDVLWVQAVFDMEEGHRKDHYKPLPKNSSTSVLTGIGGCCKITNKSHT